MSEDTQVFHLQDLVPKSLNDIVRANRDKLRLAFRFPLGSVFRQNEALAAGCGRVQVV